MPTNDDSDEAHSQESSLSATKLAVHHHLKCDLYLYNSYHGASPSGSTSNKNDRNAHADTTTRLTNAQFQRGNEWETALKSWLDAEGLLLRVHSSGPLNPAELKDVIEFDERPRFFVSGLYFEPPNAAFAERFAAKGFRPVKFGIAKPDLVEINRTNGKIQWQVIDAKASKDVKASHYVQIYFYHMCLEQMLSLDTRYAPMGHASVWLAPQTMIGAETSYKPSFDGLKSSPISLLSLTLDTFFFKKLPSILQSPQRENINWHYNPLCKGCPFETDCSTRAESEGKLGLIANLSIPDSEILESVLALARSRRRHATTSPSDHLTDIEDLAGLIRPGGDLPNLQATHPALLKKAKRILHLPERSAGGSSRGGSPSVNAVLEKEVKLIEKRNFTLPKQEDVAVLISLLIDPSTNDIAYFCITVISTVPYFSYARQESAFSTKELVRALSTILQRILDLKGLTNPECAARTTTQVYVYSIAERAALERLLVQAALTADPLDKVFQSKIRLCIGALCEGASVLATTFQPLILSGAMLNFLGKKGGRSRAELRGCLDRLGLSCSNDCSDEDLRRRIEAELERRKGEGGRFGAHYSMSGGENHRNEIGLLPRVVAVEREVKNLLALPIPGYWDLQRCAATLLSNTASVACPSDEQIFTAYQDEDDVLLDDLLQRRNMTIYDVISKVRQWVADAEKEGLLVNHARVLSSNFMDICRQDDLRKLFFMQQFEVLGRLNDLWQNRLNGCPDAVLLQYRYTHRRPSGDYQHYFELLSGNVDMATDKDRSFFNYILTEDDDDSDIPVEALFDDLGVFNSVFPLNKFNRSRWSQQAKRVQQCVFAADVVDLRLQQHGNTIVVARTFGEFSLRLKPWAYYRLSPRLVDFNLTKVLSTLVEMDLKTPSHPGYMSLPPFLQLCSDPQGFASQSNNANESDSESTKSMLDKEKAIHNALHELAGLNVEAAASLMLKPSQRRALQRVLTHRLAIIWGPPGTGKTYTLTLTLLRLLEIRYRCKATNRHIIFVSALTHAAIEACVSKLHQLIRHYESIPAWPVAWLKDVKLEHIKAGATHGLPDDGVDYIYAGTVFQLHNFSKRLNSEVDCVVIDEAGQLALGYASLVLQALRPNGRVIVAGDSEQLAPILVSQYPQLETRLFGSILDCLMHRSKPSRGELEGAPTELISENEAESYLNASAGRLVSTIVQLTENFRLNRDLGEFIQTIYSKSFVPQKQHTKRLAETLENVGDVYDDTDPIVKDAHDILVDLSSAMTRRKQLRFERPRFRRGEHAPRSSDPETSTAFAGQLPLLISLALIRLRVTTQRPETIGYETHVRGEAHLAAALVNFIRRAAPPQDRIFVATPHRIQRHAVKEALRSPVDELSDAFGGLQVDEGEGIVEHGTANNVVVDTIERLQGSEASFVICLFSSTYPTGSNTGSLDFLLERRRLNVAISRTRTLCILISSDEVLRPSVNVLTNPASAKGFSFLKSYEDRAWTTDVTIDLDRLR